MSREELHKSLEALQAEIANLEADSEAKERVAALIGNIEQQIDDPDESKSESVLEMTSGLIEQFEVEHPTITATLNRILLALGDIGI